MTACDTAVLTLVCKIMGIERQNHEIRHALAVLFVVCEGSYLSEGALFEKISDRLGEALCSSQVPWIWRLEEALACGDLSLLPETIGKMLISATRGHIEIDDTPDRRRSFDRLCETLAEFAIGMPPE